MAFKAPPVSGPWVPLSLVILFAFWVSTSHLSHVWFLGPATLFSALGPSS